MINNYNLFIIKKWKKFVSIICRVQMSVSVITLKPLHFKRNTLFGLRIFITDTFFWGTGCKDYDFSVFKNRVLYCIILLNIWCWKTVDNDLASITWPHEQKVEWESHIHESVSLYARSVKKSYINRMTWCGSHDSVTWLGVDHMTVTWLGVDHITRSHD